MVKLRSTLYVGEAFKDFEVLDNIERASFVVVSFGGRISILCLL